MVINQLSKSKWLKKLRLGSNYTGRIALAPTRKSYWIGHLSKLRSSSLHVTSVYGILMLFRTANKPYNNLCTWYTSVQNLVFNFFLVFLRDLLSFNRSRWVSTPMILGKPCTWQTFRNSKISISNPKLASIRRRTWYDKKINTLKQRLELGLK